MSLYFFKPVVWNDRGYQRPGGAKFLSGYPAEHGFGHEERNNNFDRLEFVERRAPSHFSHRRIREPTIVGLQRPYFCLYDRVPQG
jgi:hypothetical protein